MSVQTADTAGADARAGLSPDTLAASRRTEPCAMAWRSVPGLGRTHNEDAVLVDEEAGLAVLADGSGGFNAGEVASAIAVSAFAQTLGVLARGPISSLALEAISLANSAIDMAGRAHPESLGLSSTVVFARRAENRIVFGHVGDSRIYLLREARLCQLSRDHALEGMIDDEASGAAVTVRMLTRALGAEPVVQAEVRSLPILAGDLLLLCTRGLTDALEHAEITAELLACGPDVEDGAARLLERARNARASEDISLVLIRPDLPIPA